MQLPKYLTTVTPLSKALALFLFIALPFLTFNIGLIAGIEQTKDRPATGLHKQESLVAPTGDVGSTISATNPTPSSQSKCDNDECLFYSEELSNLVGYAKLEGYYYEYKPNTDFIDEPEKCQSLLVTGGTQLLIKNFRNYIAEGNTVNKLDQNNNLIVNLSLEELDVENKERIINSNKNKKVKLKVIRFLPEHIGGEVSGCYSFVDIISTEYIK